MISYFHITDLDKDYFNKKICSRLPSKILDAHSHMNLSEHVAKVSKESIADDWALQAGFQMTFEDARKYIGLMLPSIDYRFTAFPLPIKDIDLKGNNNYISSLIKSKKIAYGLMSIKPDWELDYIEDIFKTGGFIGLKPYPGFVAHKKNDEISIFEFITKEQLRLAERLGCCIVLHLPRSERLAADMNIAELKEIADMMPDLKIIIAHLGRCYNLVFLEKGIKKLGQYINRFWYDTAAVMNSAVLSHAFDSIDNRKILFGLDLPIFLWHGKRCWPTDTTYINLCREEVAFNKHIESAEQERQYTFFIYEQLNNILNVLEQKDEIKERFFFKNADGLFRSCGH